MMLDLTVRLPKMVYVSTEYDAEKKQTRVGGYRDLTDSQARVLLAFDTHGDMTDYQLGYAYRLTHGELDQSWSGLRTRRSELVTMGAIAPMGEVRNENNRKVTVWGIARGATFCW
jgi:hypothetical protein